MKGKKSKTPTDQDAFGSSRSGTDAGGKAGPARSSSNYCGPKGVASQAPQGSITGSGTETPPMNRKVDKVMERIEGGAEDDEERRKRDEEEIMTRFLSGRREVRRSPVTQEPFLPEIEVTGISKSTDDFLIDLGKKKRDRNTTRSEGDVAGIVTEDIIVLDSPEHNKGEKADEERKRKDREESESPRNELPKRSKGNLRGKDAVRGEQESKRDLIGEICKHIQELRRILYTSHQPEGKLKSLIANLNKTVQWMGNASEASPQLTNETTCGCSSELNEARGENKELKARINKLEAQMKKSTTYRDPADEAAAKEATQKYIRQVIEQKGRDINKLEEIVKLTWAPECFKITKVGWNDQSHQADTVYIIDNDGNNSKEMEKMLRDHRDIISVLTKTKDRKSDLVSMEMTNTITFGGLEEEKTTRKVHVMKIANETDLKKMWEYLCKIKQGKGETKSKVMRVYDFTKGYAQNRKCIEYLFREDNCFEEIHMRCDNVRHMEKAKVKEANRSENWTKVVGRSAKQRETIIIKKDNKEETYKQLIHKITNSVDPQLMGITINKLTSTKEGDIKVIVRGKGKDEINRFKREVESRTKLRTESIVKTKTVLVKDIHPEATEEDIRFSINGIIGNEGNEGIRKMDVLSSGGAGLAKPKHASYQTFTFQFLIIKETSQQLLSVVTILHFLHFSSTTSHLIIINADLR